MGKLHSVVQFLLILSGALGIAFVIHILLLEQNGFPPYADQIVLSYLVNALLAIGIYGLLFYFRKQLKNHIGFLFMGGSFLKFIFFFILFYPAYKADGEMGRSEFAAFFVPYAICLVIETVFMAKMLKKLY